MNGWVRLSFGMKQRNETDLVILLETDWPYENRHVSINRQSQMYINDTTHTHTHTHAHTHTPTHAHTHTLTYTHLSLLYTP